MELKRSDPIFKTTCPHRPGGALCLFQHMYNLLFCCFGRRLFQELVFRFLQIFVLVDEQRVTLKAEVDPSLIEQNKEEFIRLLLFLLCVNFHKGVTTVALKLFVNRSYMIKKSKCLQPVACLFEF